MDETGLAWASALGRTFMIMIRMMIMVIMMTMVTLTINLMIMMNQGLLGVCPGEERHLVVPAPLAYGDRCVSLAFGEMFVPVFVVVFLFELSHLSVCYWSERVLLISHWFLFSLEIRQGCW